eukprot:6594463-Alexandrium_andersonii.AAC.1
MDRNNCMLAGPSGQSQLVGPSLIPRDCSPSTPNSPTGPLHCAKSVQVCVTGKCGFGHRRRRTKH